MILFYYDRGSFKMIELNLDPKNLPEVASNTSNIINMEVGEKVDDNR